MVIAPDSFKGTVTAAGAARALAEGWRRVRPQDVLRLLPLADGGEGTLAAVLQARPGAVTESVPDSTGPDGRPVTGRYALLPDGTAVVELATASGLPLLTEPDPLGATTRGTGETIAAALDRGAERLVVAVGGSASTDGGTGLLRALGLELYDGLGRPLPDGGGALVRAASLDRSRLRAAPPGGVQVLTDVVNPLLGPDGAAAVYGPQKGADPEQIAQLERGLARLAELLGGDASAPGSGAAGGTGYGLRAGWGAELVPGASAIAELLELDAELASADLVISGEGCYDATSLQGKVVGEVARRAGAAGVPLAVVAGAAAADAANLAAPTPVRLLTLTQLAGSRQRAVAEATRWLGEAGAGLATRHR
ncbi:glycerate kinase [Streptacidiphilus carbonis]|uniref:glycerate kinase n=1 Tax=Streptacidiphilus carbonis TaxID=105422 RepID=UPI000A9FB19C|nr:glycerate kinase [Streptacidiphilus carbonis]